MTFREEVGRRYKFIFSPEELEIMPVHILVERFSGVYELDVSYDINQGDVALWVNDEIDAIVFRSWLQSL